MLICQWCDSTNTYISGHSALCVETEYKCQNCGERTWHDDRKIKQLNKGDK